MFTPIMAQTSKQKTSKKSVQPNISKNEKNKPRFDGIYIITNNADYIKISWNETKNVNFGGTWDPTEHCVHKSTEKIKIDYNDFKGILIKENHPSSVYQIVKVAEKGSYYVKGANADFQKDSSNPKEIYFEPSKKLEPGVYILVRDSYQDRNGGNIYFALFSLFEIIK
jgi:hypothetical protein